MRNFALSVVLAASLPSSAAFGDALEDANYIVEQTVTESLLLGALTAMQPVLVSSISNELASRGITLSDPDRFFEIFIEEFSAEFLVRMREPLVPLYLKRFSETELKELASFYSSSTGQSLIEKMPLLMQAQAQIGRQAGAIAGGNAGKRVKQRLIDEDIDVMGNKSLMQRLLDAL